MADHDISFDFAVGLSGGSYPTTIESTTPIQIDFTTNTVNGAAQSNSRLANLYGYTFSLSHKVSGTTYDLKGFQTIGSGTATFDLLWVGQNPSSFTSATYEFTGAGGPDDEGTLTSQSITDVVNIDAGNTVTLTATSTLEAAYTGAGTLSIAGGTTTFSRGESITVANLSLSGKGTTLNVSSGSTYAGEFTEGAGAILALGANSIIFSGPDTFAGSVTGTASLGLAGQATISSGAALSVEHLSVSGNGTDVTFNVPLSYGGTFSEGKGSTLTLKSGNLTLTGAATLVGGRVNGAHELIVKGTTSISSFTIGGTAEFVDEKTVMQAVGNVAIGDNSSSVASLAVTKSGIYDITGNGGIVRGKATASDVLNSGLFEKTGGTGTSTIVVAIANSGTVAVASGTLDLRSAITGTGKLTISNGATLEVDSTVGAGQALTFSGTKDVLDLGNPHGFGATISRFGATDAIDLGSSFTFTSFVENSKGTAGTLTVSDGSVAAHVTLLGNYLAQYFHEASAGAVITYVPPAKETPAILAAHS